MISRKLIDSIPLKYRPGRQFLFSPSFDNIDEFTLVPEEFDFTSTDRGSHLHYVGFMIDENRRDRIDTSYQAAYPQILKKLAAKSILIYCSFWQRSI